MRKKSSRWSEVERAEEDAREAQVVYQQSCRDSERALAAYNEAERVMRALETEVPRDRERCSAAGIRWLIARIEASEAARQAAVAGERFEEAANAVTVAKADVAYRILRQDREKMEKMAAARRSPLRARAEELLAAGKTIGQVHKMTGASARSIKRWKSAARGQS
jgi:leucyl aminopeptidase (aminopeptidase T)